MMLALVGFTLPLDSAREATGLPTALSTSCLAAPSPDSCPAQESPPGRLCTFRFPRTVGSQGSRLRVSRGSRPATYVPQLGESVVLSGREWRREVDPSEWKQRGEMEASAAGRGMLLAEPEVELIGE